MTTALKSVPKLIMRMQKTALKHPKNVLMSAVSALRIAKSANQNKQVVTKAARARGTFPGSVLMENASQ